MVERNSVTRKNNLGTDLSSVLTPQLVCFLECSRKKEALEKMIDCLCANSEIRNRNELAEGIFHREELMSTGIGMGVAVPHVRLASIKKPVMCAAVCRNPITDYESLDGAPVRLIFMIVAGKDQHAQYLRLLSSISSKLKNEKLRNALISASDAETFCQILSGKDK